MLRAASITLAFTGVFWIVVWGASPNAAVSAKARALASGRERSEGPASDDAAHGEGVDAPSGEDHDEASDDAARDAELDPARDEWAQVPAPAAVSFAYDEDDETRSCSPCPEDMVYVDTTFCPDIDRQCLDLEYEPINHLPICHEFARWGQRCLLRPRRIAFCIDRYEYPNRRGAHPTWMLDWYQAQATCEANGRRLCWASEWTAACEGPAHTPFPYGFERDHRKCNIDNFYVEPKKFGPKGPLLIYARDADVRSKELERLDQSVPSGSMEACRSGFGVYDMTGNLDEWVTSDVAPRELSQWAGLKGGGWGHVRSQCRPTTFSHHPGFAYYFVGFRCCLDVEGAPKWTPSAAAVPAPPVDPNDFAPEEVPAAPYAARGPPKAKFTRSGKRE